MTNTLLKKCTSRKFLVTVVTAVTNLAAVFGADSLTPEQIEGLQNVTYLAIAFVLGEGFADGVSPTNKADEAVLTKVKESDTYG